MSANYPPKRDKGSPEQPSFQNPQDILMNAPIGIITTTPDGRLLSANSAMARMFGYDSPDELIESVNGLTTHLYADLSDREELMRILRENDEVLNFECKGNLREGGTIWTSINVSMVRNKDDQILHFQSFITDITDRRRAEEALAESENRFRDIIQNASFGYYRVGKDGLWQHVNPVWEKMHSLKFDDVVGKSFESTQPADMVEEARENVRRVLSGETIEGEFSRLASDGRVEHHIFNIQPVNENGVIVAIEGFINDVTERKRAEEALLVSEERFRVLIENMAEGIVLKDAEDRYIHWNQTASDIFGIGIDDMKGQTTKDFKRRIIREDGSPFPLQEMPSLHTLRTGEPCENVVMGIKHGPQDIVWIKINTRPYFKTEDNKPSAVIISFSDISKLKQSQERIRHLNTVLQAYNQVNQVIFHADDMKLLLQEICQTLISTRGYHNAWIILLDSDRNVTHWGQAGLDDEFPEMLARFQGESMTKRALNVLSSHLLQVVIDPGNECRDCPLAESYAGMSSFSVRLEVEGLVLGLLTVSVPRNLARDSEEHKLFTNLAGTIAQSIQRIRLEEIRRIQRERLKNYELIISRIDDPMSLMGKDYKYIVVNDAYLRIFGKSREEIEGHLVEDLLGKDIFLKQVKHHLDSALAGGVVVYEDSFPDSDGSLRHKIMNYYPFHDKDGQVVGIVSAAKDITERKQAEDEIKNINQQLEKVNAEKDKLFSIIAHDLKSPMAGIFNTSQILAQEAVSLPLDDICLISAEMNKSTENALTLLDDLMQWARMSQGGMDFSPEECCLYELTRSSLYTAQNMAGKKDIIIKCEIPQDLTVLADQPMINTVIRNIIFNAVKFTPKGGNIFITAGTTGTFVEVCVKDDGIGMNDSVLSCIFTADKNKRQLGTDGEKGTGLGLVLCKEFVEKHGGDIWLESEPGKGTKVCFTLPAGSGDR